MSQSPLLPHLFLSFKKKRRIFQLSRSQFSCGFFISFGKFSLEWTAVNLWVNFWRLQSMSTLVHSAIYFPFLIIKKRRKNPLCEWNASMPHILSHSSANNTNTKSRLVEFCFDFSNQKNADFSKSHIQIYVTIEFSEIVDNFLSLSFFLSHQKQQHPAFFSCFHLLLFKLLLTDIFYPFIKAGFFPLKSSIIFFFRASERAREFVYSLNHICHVNE